MLYRWRSRTSRVGRAVSIEELGKIGISEKIGEVGQADSECRYWWRIRAIRVGRTAPIEKHVKPSQEGGFLERPGKLRRKGCTHGVQGRPSQEGFTVEVVGQAGRAVQVEKSGKPNRKNGPGGEVGQTEKEVRYRSRSRAGRVVRAVPVEMSCKPTRKGGHSEVVWCVVG